MATKQIFIGASLLLTAALPAMSKQLTPAEALHRAVATSDVARAASQASVNSIAPAAIGEAEGINTYYVFNQAPGEGFIVVSADDVTPVALLGYTDSGTYDESTIAPGLRYMLEMYSSEIAWAAANGAPATVSATAAERHDVAPILKTTWNQDAPFNNLCPQVNGTSAYVGCVATAMAQVMKAHNWPEHGQGENSYRLPNFGVITVDFEESYYDWDNMIPHYTSSANKEQREAVAKLSYDCGVAVNMDYGLDGSGAMSMQVGPSLYKYFNYDIGLRYVERDCYFLSDWLDLLYGELEAGRPILYAGISRDSAGHAFVFDGFKAEGNYVHVNWGWGGMSDGYFQVSALDPESQGIGGSTSGYNYMQDAWLGVQPPVEGSTMYPSMKVYKSFVTNSGYSRANPSSYVYFFPSGNGAAFANYSIQAVTGCSGLKLVNVETGETTYIESTTGEKTYNVYYGDTRLAVKTGQFPETGEYVVTPAFKFDEKWYDMEQSVQGSQQRSVRLTATADRLEFAAPEAVTIVGEDIVMPDKVYENSLCDVRGSLRAEGSPAYATLKLNLNNKTNTRTYATLMEKIINLEEGVSTEVDMSGFVNTVATLVDSTECNIVLVAEMGASSVVLESMPALYYRNEVECSTTKVKFNGTGGSGSRLSPARFPLDNFSATVTISCTAGFFSDQVYGAFYQSVNGYPIGILPAGVVSVNEGESVDVEINGDTSDFLEVGQVYVFSPYAPNNGDPIHYNRYIRAETSGIEDLGMINSEEFAVAENPVESTLTVNSASAISKIELYSLTGELSFSANGDGATAMSLDVAHLAPGIYIGRLVNESGSFTAKIVKR